MKSAAMNNSRSGNKIVLLQPKTRIARNQLHWPPSSYGELEDHYEHRTSDYSLQRVRGCKIAVAVATLMKWVWIAVWVPVLHAQVVPDRYIVS